MRPSFTGLSGVFSKILEKESNVYMTLLSSAEPLPMLTGFFFPFSEKPKDNSHYTILYFKYFHNPT